MECIGQTHFFQVWAAIAPDLSWFCIATQNAGCALQHICCQLLTCLLCPDGDGEHLLTGPGPKAVSNMVLVPVQDHHNPLVAQESN